MVAAQLGNRHARVGFTQETDDLLVRKSLLHVQSPWVEELDSRSPCYSKAGGVASSQRLEPPGFPGRFTRDQGIYAPGEARADVRHPCLLVEGQGERAGS